MRVSIYGFLVAVLILTACQQGKQRKEGVDLDSIDLSDRESIFSELDTLGAGIPIFYNMYLSVELSSLFETAGAVFTKELLNPYDKTSEYITSYEKAMNLGVYAVDLSYARVFEQFEVAGRYFSSMQVLSEQLGIPTDYFEETANRFEKNLTNKDSLIAIANEVYYDTEEYLKENERFATASVIILGGWVEAMYIGTYVAEESRNADIIERLIDQKYSLNNLLIMLSDYNDNEAISKYITMLEELREVVMEIDIDIPVDFDSNSEKASEQIDSWLIDVKKVQAEIILIRKEITD
jgi:hypothetical protein